MNSATRVAVTAVSGLATTWLTDQVMRRVPLPPASRPIVSLAAGAMVAQIVQRIR
jgi:hypothetical protein